MCIYMSFQRYERIHLSEVENTIRRVRSHTHNDTGINQHTDQRTNQSSACIGKEKTEKRVEEIGKANMKTEDCIVRSNTLDRMPSGSNTDSLVENPMIANRQNPQQMKFDAT